MTATITAHAHHTTAKAGSSVTITGRVTRIPVGGKLTVRHLSSGGEWTTLHASAKVMRGGTHEVHVNSPARARSNCAWHTAKPCRPSST
ncbi:hypothetical protein ABZ733_18110 [Streptomyces longwoodensis]|uniref:hypothetical protein n=1 Tax=Streptomyces longwoodensis TaxID=68231 RepID=UPI0033C8E94B